MLLINNFSDTAHHIDTGITPSQRQFWGLQTAAYKSAL